MLPTHICALRDPHARLRRILLPRLALLVGVKKQHSPAPATLEAMRNAVFTAMEIRDEAAILRGMHRGELEARASRGTCPGQRSA